MAKKPTTHHHIIEKRLASFVNHPHNTKFVDKVIVLFPDKTFNECFALAGIVYCRRANSGKLEYCDWVMFYTMNGTVDQFKWYEIPMDKVRLETIKQSTIDKYQKIIYTILTKGN